MFNLLNVSRDNQSPGLFLNKQLYETLGPQIKLDFYDANNNF